jgi:2-(1,2-epoxy-1,2-dihydrophenyl)acetyl-CoA isomerase
MENRTLAAAFRSIALEVSEGVATLTLNRPERLNAFNDAMHGEIREALERIGGDRGVRAVIITGAGRAFCAGQDLADRSVAQGDERRDAPRDLGASLEANYNPLVLALRALPLPVLCAVNGVAAGAGASIALACDVVVAARSASFIQAFSKLGLVPDCGGTYFLARTLGAPRALGLALFGERLSAEQAHSWGLIWECVDDAQLMPTVRTLAAKLAGGPTRGFARTKQAIYAAEQRALAAQLDLERDLQRELGHTRDYREGVAAFLEKRTPQFKGE